MSGYLIRCVHDTTKMLVPTYIQRSSLELNEYCRLSRELTSQRGHSGTRTRAQGRHRPRKPFHYSIDLLCHRDEMNTNGFLRPIAGFRGQILSGRRARRRRRGKSTSTPAPGGWGGAEGTTPLPPPRRSSSPPAPGAAATGYRKTGFHRVDTPRSRFDNDGAQPRRW